MEQKLEEILQECTARVEVPGVDGHGTGFFILRDLGGEAISTEVIFSELSTLQQLHDSFHSTDERWSRLLELRVI